MRVIATSCAPFLVHYFACSRRFKESLSEKIASVFNVHVATIYRLAAPKNLGSFCALGSFKPLLTPSATVLLSMAQVRFEIVNGPVLKTYLIYAPQPHA